METSFIILIEITALSLYGAIPDKMKFLGLAPWAISELTLRKIRLNEFFIKEIIFGLARETIAKYLRHNLRIPVSFTEI